MSDIKIAIISKNESLSRFFELEAIEMGIEATVFKRYNSEAYGFSMLILDTNTIPIPNLLDLSKTVLVTQEKNIEDAYKNGYVIKWPILATEVRQIYENLKFGDKIIKNSNETADKSVIYFYKNQKNTVRYGNRNILLSDCEINVLQMLCQNAKSAVSRDKLNTLFEADNGNIADVYVCKLRKKLEEDGERLIFTVRSKGYKIMASMEWE